MANNLSIKDLLGASDDGTSNWNWKESYVQTDENMATSGTFIAAESTLIGFGPAKASAAFDIVKVGLCPQISISQQITQQRLPEIGSQRVHILNGVPIGGGSMSRTLYNGPSLMRTIYGNLYDDEGNPTALALSGMMTDNTNAQSYVADIWKLINKNQDKVMEGNNKTLLWLSCWDMRIRMPFGLCMYFQDVAGNSLGGIYCEQTKINTHNLSQSSGNLIMMEGISFGFDRLIPVRGVGRS